MTKVPLPQGLARFWTRVEVKVQPVLTKLWAHKVVVAVRGWPVSRLRTQRGLLIAGCLVLVVTVGGVALRPTPIHISEKIDDEEPDGPTSTVDPEPEQAAPTVSTTSTTEAASSKALQTTTTLPFTTFEVSNMAQWDQAVIDARPGDVIKLVANFNQPLQYRGNRDQAGRETGEGVGGTAERPITITAAPDVWVDLGNVHNDKVGLEVMFTTHVNIVGVRVRNSRFGIRVQYSNGSPGSPILVADNVVTDTGHNAIHITGELTNHAPSEHIRVENNTIARTGRSTTKFGEGIYLGYGAKPWSDYSSNIEVIGNDISETTAEAVDIKAGTRNVLVADNRIHDVAPESGGVISAHYIDGTPDPDPSVNSNIVIRNNRIWNVNLQGRAGANDWAIWVGHGGITVADNMIWGMRNNGSTLAVRVRAGDDFGPHPIVITDNVFWTAGGWAAEGSPSGAHLVQASGNQGPEGARGIEVPINPGGAVPALGSGGAADDGAGPGSALG